MRVFREGAIPTGRVVLSNGRPDGGRDVGAHVTFFLALSWPLGMPVAIEAGEPIVGRPINQPCITSLIFPVLALALLFVGMQTTGDSCPARTRAWRAVRRRRRASATSSCKIVSNHHFRYSHFSSAFPPAFGLPDLPRGSAAGGGPWSKSIMIIPGTKKSALALASPPKPTDRGTSAKSVSGES